METKVMQVVQNCPIRNAAGLHGKVLDGALIYAGTVLVIDKASLHDGWVKVIGPNPPVNPDGTYLRYKEPAWVELSHLKDVNAASDTIIINIDWENKTWTAKAG